MKLKISEIFYSLQGEGLRTGTANVFIRLQGCSAKHACFKSGILCDTEYDSGKEWTVDEVLTFIKPLYCFNIVWTGGEPADQLTFEIIEVFKKAGYYQTIETSGVKPVPNNIDFISLSPKVSEHVLIKHFPDGVDELRYVRHKGQEIPQPQVKALYFFLSPHSDGWEINIENLKHCIRLIKENPQWRLSVQDHKLWNVL